VLAGGRSLRYGADKVAVLLDGMLAGLPADLDVVCVGPERPTARPVTWVRESPPYAGPLAGIAAGVEARPAARAYLLCAADMPDVGRAAGALLDALPPSGGADAAVLVDGEGVRQPLASAWSGHPLRARLAELASGSDTGLANLPVRALFPETDALAVIAVPDEWGAARDLDTPP
jgi:molybdopterin-guanine dinucleotide biosynthesis protein A